MSKIRVMDTILSNKIAAGEVVERCASVIKELVENSIDAKSKVIEIELTEAGTKQMKVIDNGMGMDAIDAPLAFERHATSKIIDEDDLYHIQTLGFRGEALASIASVSKVTLKTSTGEIGTKVVIHGGKILEVSKGDARRGTIVQIDDLFYNTPARLKHMKSLYTELSSITKYIQNLALSYPSITFTLKNNGHVILNTDGSGNQLKTFSQIFGVDIAKKMLAVSSKNEDYEINGYISLPEIHRSSQNHMIMIVNGRCVRNIKLIHAVQEAYHSYKPDNRYPIVVLNINVDPSLIDVNIHPTKMDIQFSKMDILIFLIQTMIEKTLKSQTHVIHVGDERTRFLVNDSKGDIELKPKKVYEDVTLNLKRESLELSNVIDANNIFIAKEEARDIEKKMDQFPELYPIGSIHGTYIVCQNEKGMYLIDQHAAKERINYEICLKKLSNNNEKSVMLLLPITVEFTSSESIVLKKNLAFLREMKFEIEEFGLHSFIIKAHPTWILKANEESIRMILDLVIHREKDFDPIRFNDHIAATMACKMSIKANDLITIDEMEHLIDDLKKCENPFHCPHGRPTTIFYSKGDLEKAFKRSGFDTYQ